MEVTKLNQEQRGALKAIEAAAAQKQAAEERLGGLVLVALESVPATHVADAAGISRASLYRLIERARKDASDREQVSKEQR